MVQVAPSILSADFANLGQDCSKVVTPQNPMLHFDVMDGVFVPNLSFGMPVLRSLKKALPQAKYDVHLMITDPAKYVDEFSKAGADIITFHIESQSSAVETARHIRRLGCQAGLSLRPGTPVEMLFPLLKEIDLVLVMSVEPGFGGQAFMPEAPTRIKALREEAQRQDTPLLLEVDGGIDLNTAPLCTQAGVDILVAGSAVFNTPDPAAAVQQLAGC